MTKTKHTITLDNGKTFTRTSAHAYTHVVVADAWVGFDGQVKDTDAHPVGVEFVLSWHKSEANAIKAAKAAAPRPRCSGFRNLRVVPVAD